MFRVEYGVGQAWREGHRGSPVGELPLASCAKCKEMSSEWRCEDCDQEYKEAA